MKILNLIKELSICESNLKEYRQTFKENNDFENSIKVKEFINTINEFIELSNNLDTKKDKERYYISMKYWFSSNKKYLNLLKNLHEAYKNKNTPNMS